MDSSSAWNKPSRETLPPDRAVTPIVAMAVLFALVVLTAAAVFAAGSSAVFAVQDDADTDQATKSMASMASDLRHGGDADVRLPEEGSTHVDPEASWMRVSVGNEVVIDEDEGRLGTLYYETGDTTIAYEGGGVWRKDGHQRGTVLTSPPIQYADGEAPTLAFPVVAIDDATRHVDHERLQTLETERTFPTADVSNPIEGNVTVTVHSEFYLAWGDHFAERFGLDAGAVDYDHAARETTVQLTGGQINRTVETNESDPDPPELEGIPGFVVNDGGELDARQDLRVDSYDSEDGPYPASKSDGGDVKTTGELDLSNDVVVEGDVDAGGTAKVSNNVEVTGDLIVGEGDGSTVTTIDTSGGGGSPTTIGGVFSTKEDAEVTDGVVFEDDVMVGGDLEAFEADVAGDVHVLGDMLDINDDYDGTIEGDLVVVGATNWDLDDIDLDVEGEFVTDPDATEVRRPVEPLVEVVEPDVDVSEEGDDIEDDNDNDGVAVPISDGTLDDCGTGGFGYGGCRLTAGRYYLEEIDLNKERGPTGVREPEELVLDTSDGPVEIYVDGSVDVEDTGSIEVQYDEDDPHPAIVYVEEDVDVEQGGTVGVEDHRSPLFEMYMQPDATWRIEGGSEFVGTVYGLSDGSQRTKIHLSGGSGSTIYGAFLGDVGQFDQEGQVHYDEALRLDDDADRPGEDDDGDVIVTETYEATGADVVYLHVDRRTVGAG